MQFWATRLPPYTCCGIASAGGFFCYPYLVRDPLLQSLHSEPEFQTLMNQALQRHQQFKTMFF